MIYDSAELYYMKSLLSALKSTLFSIFISLFSTNNKKTQQNACAGIAQFTPTTNKKNRSNNGNHQYPVYVPMYNCICHLIRFMPYLHFNFLIEPIDTICAFWNGIDCVSNLPLSFVFMPHKQKLTPFYSSFSNR